jgi:hypothetical protein
VLSAAYHFGNRCPEAARHVSLEFDLFPAYYSVAVLYRRRYAMNKLLFTIAFAALVFSGAAAQSALEGTWKMDFSTIASEKPDEFLLQNGIFTCSTCIPKSIKADGQYQPTPGSPVGDTEAVKVVNDHQVHETDKKDGNIVGESTLTVSADGNTLTLDFYSALEGASTPVKGSVEWKRVAKGPPGSHAISGSWQTKKLEMPENARVFTYKINGDELTMTNPMGGSYTAKLDGTEAAMKGSPPVTTVRVKLIGNDTLEETDLLHDGTIFSVSRMRVSPDGKKAKIVSENKQANSTVSVEAVKQ